MNKTQLRFVAHDILHMMNAFAGSGFLFVSF
jgi:hypothetical protein